MNPEPDRSLRTRTRTGLGRLGAPVSYVTLLYAVEVADQLSGHRLSTHGIRPLRTDGLWGVLFAPLLHIDWGHLIANTIPALVLGFLVALGGLGRFIAVTAVVWIGGGLLTWLIGDLGSSCGPTDHIGASGVIFGWLTYLLAFGFFARSLSGIAVGLVVLVCYGALLWGALPVPGGCAGVSWQGHISGALAGVAAAYLVSRPERGSMTGQTR